MGNKTNIKTNNNTFDGSVLDAVHWAHNNCHDGTGESRENYRKKYLIGSLAERLWNDETFTYGVEYGILIATDYFFGWSGGVPREDIINEKEENEN